MSLEHLKVGDKIYCSFRDDQCLLVGIIRKISKNGNAFVNRYSAFSGLSLGEDIVIRLKDGTVFYKGKYIVQDNKFLSEKEYLHNSKKIEKSRYEQLWKDVKVACEELNFAKLKQAVFEYEN